jgi:hypothetical protein
MQSIDFSVLKRDQNVETQQAKRMANKKHADETAMYCKKIYPENL